MSAQYPGAAGTDANLYVSVNNLSTALTDNPLTSGATTVNVASTTGFPTAGIITIDAEAISYTGTTGTSFTTCTRGADGTTAVSHVTGATVFHDVVAAHHNVLKDEIKAIETDLVAGMAALTPVTAASTAGSILIRLEHIISQLKNGFGLTNWYDAIATAALLKGGGTMSGVIAMGANKITGLANGSVAQDAAAFGQVPVITAGQIVGTATNDSPTAGNVGQIVISTVAATNAGASTAYFDATSISLTAGDWDLSGNILYARNSATFSNVRLEIGISTTSGNSGTGLSETLNWMYAYDGNATSFLYVPLNIPSYRVSIASTTTLYLKGNVANYSAGTPQYYATLRARRVR